MRPRRLLLLALLTIAPLVAACHTPTGADDSRTLRVPTDNNSSNQVPTDSTARDTRPWG